MLYIGALPKAWHGIAESYLTGLMADRVIHEGDTVEAIQAFESRVVEGDRSLSSADQLYVFGDGDDLRRVNAYRHAHTASFRANAQWVASVYGPMQCMLKGVCAQCLQWQVDPETGQRTKAVYACSWHHQPMDIVDLAHLDERTAHHRMQHTLTTQWLKYRIS